MPGPFYKTMDDALFAAGPMVEQHAGNVKESITLVYQKPDGSFGISAPQSSGERGSVRGELGFPKGSKPVHLVHNHPSLSKGSGGGSGDRARDLFSDGDIETAQSMGIPSGIVIDGNMSVFNPLKDRANNRRGSPFTYIPEYDIGELEKRRMSSIITALRDKVPE